MLALVVQTGAWLGAVAAASFVPGSFICTAGAGSERSAPGQGQHAPDCALCPLCTALSATALLPPTPATVPERPAVASRIAALPPPATGPPARPRRSARPRAPPQSA